MLTNLVARRNNNWAQSFDINLYCDKLCHSFIVDEDSISDWSTDSCGWSDDDFGVDLDLTTPPLSVDSGAVDTSDQEIVRCICEVEEENDFMIQVSWFIFATTLKPSFLKAYQAFFIIGAASISILCFLSVKIVCAGNTAPAWAFWKTMFQTDTPATSVETHQVRKKHRHLKL